MNRFYEIKGAFTGGALHDVVKVRPVVDLIQCPRFVTPQYVSATSESDIS